MQEDTAPADAVVAAAVEELKKLKLVVEGHEKKLEEITGVPRDKGAFRDAVVRLIRTCLLRVLSLGCLLTTCDIAGQSTRGEAVLQAFLFHLRWCGRPV